MSTLRINPSLDTPIYLGKPLDPFKLPAMSPALLCGKCRSCLFEIVNGAGRYTEQTYARCSMCGATYQLHRGSP